MSSQTIKGIVEHVRYHSAESGWGVLSLRTKSTYPDWQNADGTVSVVGQMPRAPQAGDKGGFVGFWQIDPNYGPQFKAINAVLETPEMPPEPVAEPSQRFSSGKQRSFIADDPDDDTATLRGAVERITYYNDENSWGVVKIAPTGDYPRDAQGYDNTIAVVGVMPELIEGESAEFIGQWVMNSQYGKQFKAERVVPIAPDSEEGIVRYLADTVYGIGDITAKRIYKHFGEETIAILDEDPERVREIGLKENLVQNLIEAWSSNRTIRRIMIELQGWGISGRIAKKIYDEYGNEAVTLVKNDPYTLADDVHGIGFKRADKIAREMGMAADSRQRLRAGLVYALKQMSNNGHTFMPREELLTETVELLGVSLDDIDLEGELNEQLLAKRLYKQDLHHDDTVVEAIYLPMFYHSEVGAAEHLKEMANNPSKIIFRMQPIQWEPYLEELAEQNNVELSEEQQSAVKAALTSKISVLTGGPGTGKTTTLQMVINALDEEGFAYMLASPTGRAAKRLGEATGQDAMTIHRMLGWSGGIGFEHDEDNPLKTDVLIIDEASMIDLVLLYNLLKALEPATHLMLVGDVDQLPSVGAGNVLNDVINSGIAHVTRLTQIFRQDDNSHIVTNAHLINNGNTPIMDNNSRDFFFFNMGDAQAAGEMLVDIVTDRLEKKLGEYDRFNDVQVIAPMYRGPIGVNALNKALQAALNPKSPGKAEKRFGGKTFRKGDKVMQTKNNYDKDVFNGDIGTIYAIDDDENTISVMMDSGRIDYDYTDADEQLIHAYCISTHRSQGSEYPVVVMPVMTQHYIMLQRNLLYTAITRAKRMVVLVGTHKAMHIAVSNNKVAERYTGLEARLR